jgi:hypothetical protein
MPHPNLHFTEFSPGRAMRVGITGIPDAGKRRLRGDEAVIELPPSIERALAKGKVTDARAATARFEAFGIGVA